jgi:hypothetical protein
VSSVDRGRSRGTIPEAVPVEGIVPEAEVAAGAATKPAGIASGVAPRVAEEVRCTAGVKPGSSRPFARNPRCGADPFDADVRGRRD